ncbi:hypothetical protein RRG08_033760 [Elysia crispata]|uniref:Chitin-binding type-2 domain-containing protein n=1 Tax=Elysia crispata TaxID=231223 RepID=A0AAE1ARY8_9GAST|nr:hypothetical protein RRG08_033760 [Elysia crispata]
MALGLRCLYDTGALVLLCAVSTLAQLETHPYITCPGQYNRLFQDPSDCSSYYICNNNRLSKGRCPAGQVYDPRHNSCGNYQTPSGCQSLGLTFSSSQVHHAPTYRCPESHGKFQDTNDCSGYYVCTNYQAHRYKCPNGQMFDPSTGVCSNIHNPVGCHAPDAVIVTGRGSGSCSQINAVSQDVNDCSKYFVCINYQLQSRTCPSGQLFDPSRLSCGYTQNPSGCRMPTFQSRQGTFQCTQANGQVQDTADCSRYYLCTNWQAQRMTCPNGQLFDPSRRSCGNINNPGNCHMPAGWRPSGGSSWIGQIIGSFQCRQASGQFQDSTDCSRYYLCTNWQAQRLTCPSGQLFDPSRGACGNINNPGNCQLPAGWRPSGGSSWGGPVTGSTTCPQERGEFPYAPDCSKFVRCDHFRATVLGCPGSLLFNPNRGYCDWPEHYSSHNSCTLPPNKGNPVMNIRRYY